MKVADSGDQLGLVLPTELGFWEYFFVARLKRRGRGFAVEIC